MGCDQQESAEPLGAAPERYFHIGRTFTGSSPRVASPVLEGGPHLTTREAFDAESRRNAVVIYGVHAADGQEGAVVALDWAAVRARYATHTELASLAGSSRVRVTDVDDERVCLAQRLWRDCISRRDLDAAVDLLAAGRLDPDPMAFAEGLRRHWSSRADGRPVETGCTRGPNLAAVVLTDLGYLTHAGG